MHVNSMNFPHLRYMSLVNLPAPRLICQQNYDSTVQRRQHGATKGVDFFRSTLCQGAKMSHGFTPCTNGFCSFVTHTWKTLPLSYKLPSSACYESLTFTHANAQAIQMLCSLLNLHARKIALIFMNLHRARL